MTREKIEPAVKEGIPFLIRMTGGGNHADKSRFKNEPGECRLVVIDREDPLRVPPLPARQAFLV